MKSRTSHAPLLLAFALLLGLGVAFGRPRQDEVEILLRPVAGRVHWLVGQGGNIALSVGPEGVLMVDSQFAPLAPRIEAAIHGLAGAKPTYLLNTHWHFDHTGGNPHFGAEAIVVAHENVRRRLVGDESIGGRVQRDFDPKGLPEITFKSSVRLRWNGEDVDLLHFPAAHTDGDCVVWFRESKVVHLGDLYFQVGYPFIDLDSGGSVTGYLAALRQVLAELPEEVRLIPGHGEVTGVAELREYLAMLETLAGRVREGLAAGKSAAELVADGITADFDERWGGFAFVPPQRFVETLVRGLSSEAEQKDG